MSEFIETVMDYMPLMLAVLCFLKIGTIIQRKRLQKKLDDLNGRGSQEP